MKVLLIADGGEGGIGGSEIFVKELIQRIDKKLFHIVLTCIDTGNLTDMLEDYAKGAGFPSIRAIYRKKLRIDFKALYQLRNIIKKHQINVIHTTSGYTAIAGVLSSLCLDIPVIYTIQMPVHFSRKTMLFFAILGRLIDAHISVSHAIAYSIEQGGFLIPLRKADRVIYCGVDLQRFTPMDSDIAKQNLGLQGYPVVGTVGRLIPRKGYNFLLHAVPKIKEAFPNVKFILTGEGEEENKLRFIVNQLGLQQNVIFLGTRKDIPEIMNSFDVFVLPSLSEGLGVVILEAFAVGKPVVASDIEGIPELVIHGKNGFLVPPKDSNKLADCVIALLHDPKRAKTMGEEGRYFVEKKFNINHKIKEYETLYTNCTKRRL